MIHCPLLIHYVNFRAGFVPIATCSPKSKELVTKCGAEATFDYRSSSCASDIVSPASRLATVLSTIKSLTL